MDVRRRVHVRLRAWQGRPQAEIRPECPSANGLKIQAASPLEGGKRKRESLAKKGKSKKGLEKISVLVV